jgi:rhodanese-related sulfurtransferase
MGPCEATPADAPAPGVPFTGELSASGNGETPQAIPGVTTVSARQAACLINHLGGQMLVLEPMSAPVGIPGSLSVPWLAAGPPMEGNAQRTLDELLALYTRDSGGKDRPILVYCHHVNCRLSYNAALRLLHAGQRRIYWLRDGGRAWEQAQMPLEQPLGYQEPKP